MFVWVSSGLLHSRTNLRPPGQHYSWEVSDSSFARMRVWTRDFQLEILCYYCVPAPDQANKNSWIKFVQVSFTMTASGARVHTLGQMGDTDHCRAIIRSKIKSGIRVIGWSEVVVWEVVSERQSTKRRQHQAPEVLTGNFVVRIEM